MTPAIPTSPAAKLAAPGKTPGLVPAGSTAAKTRGLTAKTLVAKPETAAGAKRPAAAAKPAAAKAAPKRAAAAAKPEAAKPASAKRPAAAAKPAAAKPAARKAPGKVALIAPELRHQMICDAAYYRAERRGFRRGRRACVRRIGNRATAAG